MNIQKLKDAVKSRYQWEQNDIGDLAKFRGKMMKITVESYSLDCGASFSIVESKGMAGLMRRNMLVINSQKKDIPMLVMQYMAVVGKRLLQIDFLDIAKDKTSLSAFNEAREIAKSSSLMEMEMAEEWYSRKRLSGSCNKQGNKADMDELCEKVLMAFLTGVEKTRAVSATEGRKLRINQFLKELFDHGCFGYDAIRVCLKQEKTEMLYRDWIFGGKGTESAENTSEDLEHEETNTEKTDESAKKVEAESIEKASE